MFNHYYKNKLTLSEQIIYDNLLNGFKKMSPSIKCQSANIDISKIIEFILMDNVDIYYIHQYKYSYNPISNIYTISPVYIIDSYLKSDYDKKIKEAKRKILQEIKTSNKWETILKLHDYICLNVKYQDFGDNCHTLLGPLLHNRGVCDGISKMFKFICNDLFVQTLFVTGKGKRDINSVPEGHAWNKVHLNGNWYNMDITFDLSCSTDTCSNHRYFMVDDKELVSNHIEDNITKTIQCNNDELNYFKIRNLESNSDSESIEIIKKNIKSKNYIFEIKFKYLKDPNKIAETIKRCIGKAILLSFMNINFSYISSNGSTSAIIMINK